MNLEFFDLKVQSDHWSSDHPSYFNLHTRANARYILILNSKIYLPT